METRRIRRLARRRVYRTVALAASLAAFGFALGMALPRNALASGLAFVAAMCCVLVVVMRDDSIAPIHGLHRVIRLPLRQSVSATLDSFWSRIVGTARAVFTRTPRPAAVALDEPDDESEAWWGNEPRPMTPLLAESVPPVPALPTVSAVVTPETLPPPLGHATAAPVLAAPVRSAHVPAAKSDAGPALVDQVLDATRRRVDAFAKRFRRHNEEAGAST